MKNQKNRIKEAYIKGIVEVNDFSEDYRVIEEKLNLLEEKRIQSIDLNKQTFSPQQIMADRDVEKDEKGYYNLVNIKFRSNFLEQICKIINYGMFDFAFPCTKGKEETTISTTIQMDKKELEEYMKRLNDYYEVSYYELDRLDEPKKEILFNR